MTPTNTAALDHCVRTYRKISGLTQGDVATLMGLKSSDLICLLEKGNSIRKGNNMFALAIIFDTPIEMLFAGMLEREVLAVAQRAKNYKQHFLTRDPKTTPRYQERLSVIEKLTHY